MIVSFSVFENDLECLKALGLAVTGNGGDRRDEQTTRNGSRSTTEKALHY